MGLSIRFDPKDWPLKFGKNEWNGPMYLVVKQNMQSNCCFQLFDSHRWHHTNSGICKYNIYAIYLKVTEFNTNVFQVFMNR